MSVVIQKIIFCWIFVSGKADYLVTGDADLLSLNPFRNTEIVDYNSFQQILNEIISE